MVNIKKSLLGTILVLLLSSLCFSQEAEKLEENQTVLENTQNSVLKNTDTYENNESYFTKNNENLDTEYKPASTAWTIVKFIFFLVLVIIAIYFLMRFFKNKNNVSKSDDEFLRRVSYMTLSPGKTVEIVTLLDKGYILGVTDSNINLISEIEDKELIEALNLNFDKKQTVKKPMNFSDVLDMFMGKNQNKKNDIYNDIENNISKINRNPFKRNNKDE